MTVDIFGNLYICDRMAQRNLEPGRDIAVIVAGGNGEGAAKSQLANPLGIIVADNGDVYVASVFNARVQRWPAH